MPGEGKYNYPGKYGIQANINAMVINAPTRININALVNMIFARVINAFAQVNMPIRCNKCQGKLESGQAINAGKYILPG